MRWPKALFIAAHELRARIRDRTLLIVAFAGPIMFAAITGLAFSGLDLDQPIRLVVVAGPEGDTPTGVVKSLKSDPRVREFATVDVAPTEQEARSRVLRGTADAGIVLSPVPGKPSGAVQRVTILENQDEPVAAGVTEALVQYGGGQEFVDEVVVATLRETVKKPAETLRGFRPHNPVTLTDVSASARPLRSTTYFGFSMAMVFLLFSVMPVAKSLWADRQSNVLHRFLSSGVSPWAVVAGKALVGQLIGMLSITTVWVATRVMFDANWGPPSAVVPLIAVTAAVAVSLSFAIAAVARTEAQIDGLTPLVTFLLVLAGGNFVPPTSMPPVLQNLTLLTPNGWELRGFLDIATTRGGIELIYTPLLVLLTFSTLLWLLAAARIRTLMSP
jgi:ABC-2 type transport system permease protein